MLLSIRRIGHESKIEIQLSKILERMKRDFLLASLSLSLSLSKSSIYTGWKSSTEKFRKLVKLALLKLIIELANFRLHGWLTSKFPAVTLSLLNHPYRRPHPLRSSASSAAGSKLHHAPRFVNRAKPRQRRKNKKRGRGIKTSKGIFTWQLIKKKKKERKKKKKKNTWNDDHTTTS